MYDVTALGELLIDFAPVSVQENGYPVLSAQPGGAPGNFLAALKKYGCSTAMIGKVGNDMFGRLLVQTLKDAGIGTEGVLLDPDQFTTLAFVALDADGNRDFSFARKPGADTCLRPEEIDESLITDAKVFHFGTLSLTNEPVASATRRAVELAKARKLLVSLDPNLRKPLWPREEDAKAAIEWSLRQADIVKISDEEIEWLWGISPEQGAQKLLKEYGVSLVYATLGPKGCHAATENTAVTVSSPSGIHVKDTTGAGDIFGGSAMSCFLKKGKSPGNLSTEDLMSIVRFACAAASLSTRKHGGISSVPEEAEVRACVQTMV
uniref:Fructokinase-2 n=1 Tax=uncultured bacterium Contig12 TaxID=1393397 RepID=W0FIU6_9BACT|nr:fructokinase-2 [uncultured bacterium Contig12]